MLKNKISIVVAVLAAIAFVTNCQEQGSSKPKTLTGVATFVKGKVLVNASPLRIGTKVKSHDVINVKKKAGAIIQFSTGALITLKAKTKLEVSRLFYGANGTPVVNLYQTRGSTFSKIVPNKAEFTLKTPTAVAGVRGTSFSVTVSKNKKSEIRLLKGKIEVRSIDKNGKESKPVIISSGQKITVTKAKGLAKTKKMAAGEKQSLETLDTVSFLSEKSVSAESSIIQKEMAATPNQVISSTVVDDVIAEKIVIAPKKIDGAAKPKAKKLTLADLKSKYGKLTKIITHSGKAYVGGDWKQVGDYHYIRTISGKRKVKTSKVFKVLPLD